MIKIKKGITAKILVDVILAMLVLGVLLIYVGYLEVSVAIEKQYEDTALRTGRTALTFADVEKIPYYNDLGGEYYDETMKLANEWQRLAETQGATFIYIIEPNIEKDYNEIRFSLSVMNSKANYEHYDSGHIRQTSNEEYRRAYIDLYENHKDFATIIRDKGVSSTGDHITILLPVKDAAGEVKGILCVQRQMDDLRVFRISYLKATLLLAAVVFLVVILSYAVYINKTVLNPIKTLASGVHEISGGQLDKKIEIKTGDEIETLAETFNTMTSELQDYMTNLTKVTAEKERISTELHVAKDIQRGMLPNTADFDDEAFDVYATMNAAKEVGGDFYDLYLLDENHLVITVADVSGKGIPASLFMVISKTVLKNFATFATNPDDYAAVMSCANDQLCEGNEEMMFVTVFFGVLEISTGKFVYVNGGHNPPVIYHSAENNCEYLKVNKNFVLGGMEGVPYKQQEITLEHGDLIFVYTDGVNEAMNIDNEEYTSERLLKFMNSTNCHADLKDLLAAVKGDVDKHVGAAAQSDDITMLALRRN